MLHTRQTLVSKQAYLWMYPSLPRLLSSASPKWKSKSCSRVFRHLLKRRGMAWPGKASLGQWNGWLRHIGWIGFKYIIFYTCNLQNNNVQSGFGRTYKNAVVSYDLKKYICAKRTGQTNIPYNLQNQKYTSGIWRTYKNA